MKQTPAWQQFKEEVAQELSVDLTKGGDITARQAGHLGGQMVRRLVALAKNRVESSTAE